jgi:RNA polymerase sigma factor (sigma-70 family)
MSLGASAQTDVPDEELVRLFQSSADGNIFAELFGRHRRHIYSVCRGFFCDGSFAEDATQETFLRAYQSIHSFHDGNFCAWLHRIAKHVCIDLLRKLRREVGAEESEMETIPGESDLDEKADLRIAVKKVRKEIEALSTEQRQCLEMTIEGYSYEETAGRTGLSVKAVKSHIQNGRRNLWSKMGKLLTQLR